MNPLEHIPSGFTLSLKQYLFLKPEMRQRITGCLWRPEQLQQWRKMTLTSTIGLPYSCKVVSTKVGRVNLQAPLSAFRASIVQFCPKIWAEMKPVAKDSVSVEALNYKGLAHTVRAYLAHLCFTHLIIRGALTSGQQSADSAPCQQSAGALCHIGTLTIGHLPALVWARARNSSVQQSR